MCRAFRGIPSSDKLQTSFFGIPSVVSCWLMPSTPNPRGLTAAQGQVFLSIRTPTSHSAARLSWPGRII